MSLILKAQTHYYIHYNMILRHKLLHLGDLIRELTKYKLEEYARSMMLDRKNKRRRK